MPRYVEPSRWRCPACQTTLTVPPDGPRERTTYRCPTCRLELVPDFQRQTFVVRPLDVELVSKPSAPPRPLSKRWRTAKPKRRA